LLWDETQQSEIRCRLYQDRYNYRSGESLSEHYIRYANMASILSPAMSDQDLLGAMISHYEPRIQRCLISANLKSTQETLAFLTKLQSLENSRVQYRSAQRDFGRQDQNRRILRGQPIDSMENRTLYGSVHVRHVRRDGRDRNHRGDSMRNSRTNQGLRGFYGGQGRLNDGTDSQLNAAAQDFTPYRNQSIDNSRSPNRENDRVGSSDLNA
jgi:hypothetical protein